MRVLGIETSCDETSAGIVESGNRRGLKLLANVTASSIELHREFGGVVPEIAARSHIESINAVINQALSEGLQGRFLQTGDLWSGIDAIAVTKGPGLSGSLIVGVLTARTLAIVKNKPLYGVNHVLAHLYASFITEKSPSRTTNHNLQSTAPQFPILALIASGGHTLLVLLKSHAEYQLLGTTSDDAVGEAYDKAAKMLGLPYPGGPAIEKLAEKGDPSAYKLPKPKTEGEYDFSYSGLKTAVLRLAQREIGADYNFPSHKLAGKLSNAQKADIAASFNRTAIEYLTGKTKEAFEKYAPKSVVVAGGVSASPELRRQMKEALPVEPFFPDPKLCTDNGAMVAAAGYFMRKNGVKADSSMSLDINPSLFI